MKRIDSIAAAAPTESVAADSPGDLLNRELSWLAFNDRVLHEAIDERTPLLERVRFLGIFTSNLDEFFMKRVGGLKRQVLAGVVPRSADGLTTASLLQALPEIRPLSQTDPERVAALTACLERHTTPASQRTKPVVTGRRTQTGRGRRVAG